MRTGALSSLVPKLVAIVSLLVLNVASAQIVVESWVQRYSHSAGSREFAAKVVVDNAGNVIVAGDTDDGVNAPDFVIIKYSGEGVPLWTNVFSGPDNGSDSASDMAVDRSGNVFVTGSSIGDYVTVAYSGAGAPLWTNRYNGPANGVDGASAVAVDGAGNVFVTGSSSGGCCGASDFATVAYSVQGVPLWTNRYNGPENTWHLQSSDIAHALAVDGSGNVIVTGGTDFISRLLPPPEPVTIKYSGAGVPLWTNRFTGIMAVTASGNIIMAGTAIGPGGSDDYATVAYSGAGTPLWTNYYDGPGHHVDIARAVTVDGSGKVFVTGRSRSGGDFLSEDYATVAYSDAGVPLWTNRYDGPGNSLDDASAVAVDGSGNVIVTGSAFTNVPPYYADFTTVAYSGAGVPLWTNRYNGPANGDDRAVAMALDGNGNVFVFGHSVGNDGNFDLVTIRYSVATPLPILLHHQLVGNQLVLKWTDAAFRLQSAPAVQGDYTDVPGATNPYSTPFSDAQRFYRLKAD